MCSSASAQRWMKGDFHPVQAIASGVMLDPYVLTIGFARRFATYKRANLIFSDLDRLLDIDQPPQPPGADHLCREGPSCR